ncbi:MAG: HAD family hydrolase [Acidimicrobiaceae bacterium]|nr:HAD family hydrolase [Acidimicrobiaceae bacterium]HAB57010.1 HAD family hydrolase [Acidimicrobiaceae bacterium]
MVIQAVLFDFGGVILSSPFEAFNRYEVEAGLPPGTIRGINATNPDDNAWAHFERGECSARAFVEAFEAEALELGFVIDGTRVIASLRGVLRPAMVEALRRCSANFKTAMLTNNFTPPTGESGTKAMVSDVGVDGDGASLTEIHDLFDEIVESSVVGVRKPERRFYEIACERLDVEPSVCVFLDDLGINLKPAKAMGMQTIKVVDPDIALEELEAIIKIPLR